MVLFTIGQDQVTWDVSGEHASDLWLDPNRDKLERYVNDVSTCINQILGIEHMLNSENIQLRLIGDNNIDIDFFVFKDQLSKDRSTELFFECLIARKIRVLDNLRKLIYKMDKEEISIRWEDDIVNIIDRIWVVDNNYNLKSYLGIEEE